MFERAAEKADRIFFEGIMFLKTRVAAPVKKALSDESGSDLPQMLLITGLLVVAVAAVFKILGPSFTQSASNIGKEITGTNFDAVITGK